MKSGDVVKKLEADLLALVQQAIRDLKKDHNLLLTSVDVNIICHHQGSLSRPDDVICTGVSSTITIPGIHPHFEGAG